MPKNEKYLTLRVLEVTLPEAMDDIADQVKLSPRLEDNNVIYVFKNISEFYVDRINIPRYNWL